MVTTPSSAVSTMSWLRSSERRSACSALRRRLSARSPRQAFTHTKARKTMALDSANIATASFEAQDAAALEVQRQRAGEQRHDDGRRQSAGAPSRHPRRSLARSRAMPASVRSVSAAPVRSSISTVVCAAMSANGSSGSPPNRYRDRPSQADQHCAHRQRLVRQRRRAGAVRTAATRLTKRRPARWPAPCAEACARRRPPASARTRAGPGRRPSRRQNEAARARRPR